MALPARVALGTMHGKEAVLGPPLAALGVKVERAVIDTDRFGTFSGEVARAGTMLDAARQKARAAMAETGLPVGLASEGAYGPHPHIPFLPLGQELLLWLDGRTGQEVVETMTDPQPNYDQITLTDATGLEDFLTRIGWPGTAVIVQPAHGQGPVAKGLCDRDQVSAAVADALRTSGAALVQTDMRAHMNPRRMQVIGDLAGRLAARLATPCPACAAPGFGRLRGEPGLPCDDCGTETPLVAADIFGCTLCGREERRPRMGLADPAHCPICNP